MMWCYATYVFDSGDGMHGQGSLQGKDAISISVGENIIVDHCSASWSLDEVLSSSTREPTLSNITVQWCFITEGLNPSNHGYGSLIRGTGGARYSYIKNLYAHHRGRSPRPGNYDSNPYTEDPKGLLLDFRNNVIYNWGGGYAGYNSDDESVTRLNYVGNYLVPGANSENNGVAYATGSPYNQAFFAGNFYNGVQPEDQWSLVSFRDTWTEKNIRDYKQAAPFENRPGDDHEREGRLPTCARYRWSNDPETRSSRPEGREFGTESYWPNCREPAGCRRLAGTEIASRAS